MTGLFIRAWLAIFGQSRDHPLGHQKQPVVPSPGARWSLCHERDHFLGRASAGSVLMNCPTHLAILCQTFVGSCQDGAPYGSGRFLGWLVDRSIAAHVPVRDNSEPEDGTFSRSDFRWKVGRGGKAFTSAPTARFCTPAAACTTAGRLLYRASKFDCDVCALKMQCCPKEPSREIPRDLHEHARDVARRLIRTKAFSSRATSAGASRCALPI